MELKLKERFNKAREAVIRHSPEILDAALVSVSVIGTFVLSYLVTKWVITSIQPKEDLFLVSFQNNETGAIESYVLSQKGLDELHALEEEIREKKAAEEAAV